VGGRKDRSETDAFESREGEALLLLLLFHGAKDARAEHRAAQMRSDMLENVGTPFCILRRRCILERADLDRVELAPNGQIGRCEEGVSEEGVVDGEVTEGRDGEEARQS